MRRVAAQVVRAVVRDLARTGSSPYGRCIKSEYLYIYGATMTERNGQVD